MTPKDADEYTQALGQVVAGGWRQIALGQRLGVPKALGLTVDQWVKQRLGGYVKYSVEERTEAIRALAGEGFTTPEIKNAVGSTRNTVRKALKGSKGTKRQQKIAANKALKGSKGTKPLDVLTGLAATTAIQQQVATQATRGHREQQHKAVLKQHVAVTIPGLIHGDFRARYTEALAPDSVQLVLTDPPYEKDAIGSLVPPRSRRNRCYGRAAACSSTPARSISVK